MNNGQPPAPEPVVGDLKNPRRRKAAAAEAERVDRLPPHAPEAEQGVLGCCLVAPGECLPLAITRFRGSEDPFYDLRHQTIFAHLMQMAEKSGVIDLITLQQRLKDFDLLDEVGGIPYLGALQDCISSPANLPNYLEIVVEKFLLRKMIRTCMDFVTNVYDHEGDVTELIDRFESEAMAIRADTVRTEAVPMKELVGPTIQTIENFFNRQGVLGGISTGFADLDRMTDGLQPGEVYVLAARPSLGKTSLLLNIFEHISGELQLPCVIFSLEMTKESLALRMITSRARVNLRNIREGFMAETDFPKLTSAAGKLMKCPLYIDDSPSLSITEVRARARRYVQLYGIKVVGIDYLQLASSITKRGRDNRQQEIAEISGGAKALAKELRVPVILLSQLNREIEREKHRKPKLSDLRESGAIEQDADLVGLLYKPSRQDDDDATEEPDGVPVNLFIAKQRNGPIGEVNLTFLKPYTRFESAAKVSDEDVQPDLRSASPDP